MIGVHAAGHARLARLAREHRDGHVFVEHAHLAHDRLEDRLVARVAEAVGAADDHAVARAGAVRLAAAEEIVNFNLPVAGGLLGKVGHAAAEKRVAHLAAVVGVERKARERVGEALHVAGLDEKTRDLVFNDRRHAADVRRHRGEVRPRALGQRIGEALGEGGERVDVQRAVKPVEIRHPAEEEDAVLQPELLDERFELLALHALARDGQTETRAFPARLGERAQQRRNVLHRVETRRDARDHVVRVHGIAEGGEVFRAVRLRHGVAEVETVINGKEIVRLEAAVDQPLAQRVGHAHAVVEPAQGDLIRDAVGRGGKGTVQIVQAIVAVHGRDHRHVETPPQDRAHEVRLRAVAVHHVVAALADRAAQLADAADKAVFQHPGRDAELARPVGKGAGDEADELHLHALVQQIAQQGVDMRSCAAGVAAADEMDDFHRSLRGFLYQSEKCVIL